MKQVRWLLLAGLCAMLAGVGSARAETKVVLKSVHLCCGQCVSVVGGILKDAGCKGACDQKEKTVTITAPDDAAAAKAITALADKGFHGTSDNKELAMKDDSGAEKGKVEKLTVTGAHNCCGNCCKTLKATVKKVEGVKGDTAKPKAEEFEVTGDFDAAELVKALNAAGFHVKVKK